MKAITALYLAQAREFLRDRSAVLFVLALPVAFGVFFGLVFSEGGSFTLQLGLTNEDLGPVGAQIVENLRAPEAKGGYNLSIGEREGLMAILRRGDLHALLVLPENLSQSVMDGQSAVIEVFYDTANPTSADFAVSIVRTLLNEINLALSGSPPILEMEPQPVQTNPLRSIDFFMPGMLGVALLWLGIFGTAQPIVSQRETQILRRIGVTPVSRLTILTAEVSWRVTVGLLQAPVFLLVGYFGFGVGVISWLPFIGAILLGTLVFVSLGYVLAGLGRSTESVMAISQLINFPMMMLSGSIFMVEMLPDLFRPIMSALPLTYLSDLLRQTMVGAAAMHPMGLDFAVLGGWLAVLFLLAVKLWRWE
jgi:ABC-2 type transport system permease protein